MSTKFIFDSQESQLLTSNNCNLWTTTTGTTFSGMSGTSDLTISYQYPSSHQMFDYIPTKVKIDNEPVNADIINNFPFKRNNYQGFAEQLQGEFDSWIGNIRQELFA